MCMAAIQNQTFVHSVDWCCTDLILISDSEVATEKDGLVLELVVKTVTEKDDFAFYYKFCFLGNLFWVLSPRFGGFDSQYIWLWTDTQQVLVPAELSISSQWSIFSPALFILYRKALFPTGRALVSLLMMEKRHMAQYWTGSWTRAKKKKNPVCTFERVTRYRYLDIIFAVGQLGKLLSFNVDKNTAPHVSHSFYRVF